MVVRGTPGIAAALANDSTQVGFADWFLPSKLELHAMFINLHENGHGNFDSDTYHLSSSEADSQSAWAIRFDPALPFFHM